jgi:hypothetical protein
MAGAARSEIIAQTMAENEQSRQQPQGESEVPVARVWQQPPPVPVVPISPPPPPPPPPQAAYVSAYGGSSPPPPASPDYAGAGAYGSYTRPSKPAAIATIGVLSIVIASISIIASGVSAVQALVHGMMMQMSQAMSAVAAAQAAQAAAQAAATQPVTAVAADGLDADERATIVSVLTARQGLNPARQAQLDDLLAQAGQSMLRLRARAVTSDAVRRAIASTSRGRAVNAGEIGPDYITTPTGKIELYDGNGVFRPDDRSRPTIRSKADVNHYLAVTGQGGNWPPGATSVSATAGATAVSAPAAPPPAPARVRISPGPMFGVLIQCLLSLLLAIYLLVIGILTVRGSRAGWKLHLVYALLKLPLVALGAFVWWQLQTQFLTVLSTIATNASVTRGGPRISPTSVSLLSAHVGWIAALAAVYPVVLLVLLSSRDVREYYRGG